MSYYHFLVTPNTFWLCMIVLPWGKYEYCRIPMGISVAHNTFIKYYRYIPWFQIHRRIPGRRALDNQKLLEGSPNFCSNSKCSDLKLVCTFAHFFEGKTIEPIRIDVFGINFPVHPCSQFSFITFHIQDNIMRGKARISHGRTIFPTGLHPRHHTNPHFAHIRHQFKHAPRHFVPLRATGGMFTLRFKKSLLHTLTLFLHRYLPDMRGRGVILDRRRKMDGRGGYRLRRTANATRRRRWRR